MQWKEGLGNIATEIWANVYNSSLKFSISEVVKEQLVVRSF